MRRAALLVFLLGALASCGGPAAPTAPEEPAAPLRTLEPADAAQIRGLIADLFPPPFLSAIAGLHFRLIQQQLRFHQIRLAQESARIFIVLASRLHEAGLLTDPNGPDAPTTEASLARLVQLLLEFVGLNPAGLEVPPGAFEPDGAFQACGPHGCTVVTGTQHAGVLVPPGAFDKTVYVAIARIPGSQGPLDTALRQYPLYYEVVVLPDETPDVLATVGLCVVDPPDPFAPDPDVVSRLRLAHPHPSGEGIEILPLAVFTSLDCSDASSLAARTERLPRWARTLVEPVARLLEPEPLLAGPGNLGGQASSFSPFAAVDPESSPGRARATSSETPRF